MIDYAIQSLILIYFYAKKVNTNKSYFEINTYVLVLVEIYLAEGMIIILNIDNNTQKLSTSLTELIMQKTMFESGAKASPESLTAQIRGLNDLTDSLSNYLKEHCESKSN